MSLLFTPAKIGSLEIPNRIIRSATAELMANDLDGSPREQLKSLWVDTCQRRDRPDHQRAYVRALLLENATLK